AAPEEPTRPVLPGHRPPLGGLHGRRRDRARAGEEARPRHALGDRGRQHPPPAVLPGLPRLHAGAAEHAARARRPPAGPGAPAVGGAALPASGTARAERRPGAGRRRRRPLRQGRSERVLLAAGTAHEALPAEPGRALLPRPAPRVDGAARPVVHRVPAGRVARTDDPARTQRLGVPRTRVFEWDREREEMSRTAYSSVRPACKSSASADAPGVRGPANLGERA